MITYSREIGKRATRGADEMRSVPESFAELRHAWLDTKPSLKKADYGSAFENDYRRTRLNLGGTADAHYYRWLDFWRTREYVRDFDRNDILVGQLVDRAVANIVGPGFRCDPETGDTGLNRDLREAWLQWWSDPRESDLSSRHPGEAYEALCQRAKIVDGDIFVRLFWTGPHRGKVQYLEADRIDSPGRIDDAVIHGIEIDDFGAPKTYYVLKHKAEWQKWRRYYVPDVSDNSAYDAIPAVDSEGRPNVLHIYSPSRVTQTRGITAFHAAFEYLSMFEDVQFAKLLQQQVVSCAAMFINSDRDIQFGPREREVEAEDGSDRWSEGLQPGKIFTLYRGESAQGFSPNVPNPEFFEHVKLLLRLIGGAIGIPLEIALMDTTNTTFHGYRGALQQARLGFIREQKTLRSQLHSAIYSYWLTTWLQDNYSGFEKALAWKNKRMRRVRFIPPGWSYIQPMTDAQADALRQEKMLESPRAIAGERGRDWDDIVAETVEDQGSAIEKALMKAEEIEKRTGVRVDWHEFLGRTITIRSEIGPKIEAEVERGEAVPTDRGTGDGEGVGSGVPGQEQEKSGGPGGGDREAAG